MLMIMPQAGAFGGSSVADASAAPAVVGSGGEKTGATADDASQRAHRQLTLGQCPATCYGYSCEHWNGNTCSELENYYDCDCDGCDCGTPDPTGAPTITGRPSASPAPTPSPTTCFDTNRGAINTVGSDCSAYAAEPQYCGSGFDDENFSSNDMCCACGGGSSSASPTEAPTVTDMPSVSPAPTDQVAPLLVTGSCVSAMNDIYEPIDATLDGRWYFQGVSNGMMLYFDQDCDGGFSDSTDRWIFDDIGTHVSTIAEYDLDGDGDCTFVAYDYVYENSAEPPLGTNTWAVSCEEDSLTDVDLTITHTTFSPTETPTHTVNPTVSSAPTSSPIQATAWAQIKNPVENMDEGDELRFELAVDLTCPNDVSFYGDRSVQLAGHAAAGRPTLSGGGSGTRFFDVQNGAKLQLENLVLIDGYAQDDGYGWNDIYRRGGAIIVYDATLILIKCAVRSCYAFDYVSFFCTVGERAILLLIDLRRLRDGGRLSRK